MAISFKTVITVMIPTVRVEKGNSEYIYCDYVKNQKSRTVWHVELGVEFSGMKEEKQKRVGN